MVWHTGIGNSRYREFVILLVVPEPVLENLVHWKSLEKFGTGKKSLNRYRKNLVPKKVSEPVSEKFGAVKSPRTSIKIKLYFCQPILGFGRFMMVTAKLQNVMFFTQSKNSKLILPQENCLTILPISIVQFFFCFLSFSLCSNLSIWPGRQVVLHRWVTVLYPHLWWSSLILL